MKGELWQQDSIQFPRLLAEIAAVGLTKPQMKALRESMDLTDVEIEELLERACSRFEKIKEQHCGR